MKIVINACYGGFGLSNKALRAYLKLKGKELYCYTEDYTTKIYTKLTHDNGWTTNFTKDFGMSFKAPEFKQCEIQSDEYKAIWDYYIHDSNIPRDDPDLVKVVEELNQEANGFCAKLKIVEIPDGTQWEIDEYDGLESVHEVHRSWN